MGNVTGIGAARRESGDVVGGAGVCVRHHAGRLCQNFYLDSGRASHAGDTVAWMDAVEGTCKNDCRMDVCPGLCPEKRPMVDEVAVCPSCVRRGPSCPCADVRRGRLADGGRETWAFRGDGRHLARGRIAVAASCRRVRNARRSGARRRGGAALV